MAEDNANDNSQNQDNQNQNAQDNKDNQVEPLSLDDVHDQEVSALEEGDNDSQDDTEESSGDDSKEEDSSDDSDNDNDDDSQSDEDSSDSDEEDDDSGDDSDDSDDSEGGDDEDEEEEDSDSEEDTSESDDDSQELEPPKTDKDTSKPGKYKSEFIDIDGNKIYVNSMDELPDDFEPKNMKEYGKSIHDLTGKQGQLKQDQYNYQKQVAQNQTKERISRLRKGWDNDISNMDKSGELPKDKSKRQAEIDGTFELMESEMKKGNVIDSFKVANELYKGRQQAKSDAKADVQDKKNKAKKKRGSSIQSGNPSASGANKPKTIEAPPSGTSLDDVHSHVLGSL